MFKRNISQFMFLFLPSISEQIQLYWKFMLTFLQILFCWKHFKSCVFFFMLSMLNFSKKLFAQFLLEKNGPFWKNDGVKIEIFKILTILLGLFYYNWNNVLFNNILSIGNFWYIHLTCNHSLSTMSKNRKYFNWIVPTCLHEIFRNLI